MPVASLYSVASPRDVRYLSQNFSKMAPREQLSVVSVETWKLFGVGWNCAQKTCICNIDWRCFGLNNDFDTPLVSNLK